MTSRERVLKALAHQEPDRVPIDLGATRVTGIHAIAYNRLKTHLGVQGGDIRIFDLYQQLAEVEDAVLQRFQVDVVALQRVEQGHGVWNLRWKPWRLPDGSPCLVSEDFDPVVGEDGSLSLVRGGVVVRKMLRPPMGLYFFGVHHPLAGDITLEDVDRYDWPVISDQELDLLHQRARRLYEETDYAIVGDFGGNILEWGQDLRGWDVFLMDLVRRPELASYLMDKMVEVHLQNLARYLEAVGDYIQVIMMGDDLGTQTGPQISPRAYREMIKPRHQRLYRFVKEHSSAYVFLHSCGSIYELIPDLIEAGVEILNPVQTSAAKMDPARLKAEFGDRLTFWGGGVEGQRVLPFGTPAQVREQVRERLEVFAPGGGYVFAPIHNIQPDVPAENIVAAYDAALEFGRCRIP